MSHSISNSEPSQSTEDLSGPFFHNKTSRGGGHRPVAKLSEALHEARDRSFTINMWGVFHGKFSMGT